MATVVSSNLLVSHKGEDDRDDCNDEFSADINILIPCRRATHTFMRQLK